MVLITQSQLIPTERRVQQCTTSKINASRHPTKLMCRVFLKPKAHSSWLVMFYDSIQIFILESTLLADWPVLFWYRIWGNGGNHIKRFQKCFWILKKKENSRAVVSSCKSGSSKISCLIKTIIQWLRYRLVFPPLPSVISWQFCEKQWLLGWGTP